MKKEWMYFIAGLVLMAAVLSFSILKDTSTDCVAVAKYVENGEGYLTKHEKQMADFIRARARPREYVKFYVVCLQIEEGRI